MKSFTILGTTLVVLIAMLMVQCEKDTLSPVASNDRIELRAKPVTEAGNNLSFPVLWTDGVDMQLPGTPGMEPVLNGEWWYVWGPDPIDPQSPIYSCMPDPDNPELCADGSIPGEGYDNLAKAYLQKDPGNTWQAENFAPEGYTYVDLIDWGDNLESVDWTLKSQVRTEVALYKTGVDMLQYAMKHVTGWGTSEVHGLATDLDDVLLEAPGDVATIYSHNARLTIQRLLIPREDIEEGMLEWVPEEGWTEVDPEQNLVNDPIFNEVAYDGDYGAEVNVKGKVIYGYTWNVRRNNDGPGDYRITFSLDDNEDLFTSLLNAEIIVPIEEEERGGEPPEEGGGATAVLLGSDNLTYIDIRIVPKSGGGKGNQ